MRNRKIECVQLDVDVHFLTTTVMVLDKIELPGIHCTINLRESAEATKLA